MGSTQNCSSWLRCRRLIICLLLILVLSLTEVRFMVHGRAISSQLIEATQEGLTEDANKVVKIGSIPPRCNKRCIKCGHCEAVQVPVVPKLQNHKNNFSASKRTKASSLKNIEYSRGDFISNYKPMSWKCKCGDFFFNP